MITVLYVAYILAICVAVALGSHPLGSAWIRVAGVFFALVCISLLTEFVGLLMELTQGNNNNVYNVADLIQVLVTCLYFYQVISTSRRLMKGLGLCLLSVVVWAFTISGHSENVNQYYLFYAGTLVMFLGFLQVIQLYRAMGTAKLTDFAHFWFVASLMFYWACNLVNWQLFSELAPAPSDNLSIIANLLLLSGLITFTAIAIIFAHMPKLINKHKFLENG